MEVKNNTNQNNQIISIDDSRINNASRRVIKTRNKNKHEFEYMQSNDVVCIKYEWNSYIIQGNLIQIDLINIKNFLSQESDKSIDIFTSDKNLKMLNENGILDQKTITTNYLRHIIYNNRSELEVKFDNVIKGFEQKNQGLKMIYGKELNNLPEGFYIQDGKKFDIKSFACSGEKILGFIYNAETKEYVYSIVVKKHYIEIKNFDGRIIADRDSYIFSYVTCYDQNNRSKGFGSVVTAFCYLEKFDSNIDICYGTYLINSASVAICKKFQTENDIVFGEIDNEKFKTFCENFEKTQEVNSQLQLRSFSRKLNSHYI